MRHKILVAIILVALPILWLGRGGCSADSPFAPVYQELYSYATLPLAMVPFLIGTIVVISAISLVVYVLKKIEIKIDQLLTGENK